MAAGAGVSDPAQHWLTLLSASLGNRPAVNNGIGGETSTDTAGRQTADQSYRDYLTIIWTGTNGPALPQFATDITSMVAHLTGRQRFLLMPPMIPATSTPNDPNKLAMRAWLASNYPNNYIDVCAMLAANGNGSAADNADIANGFTPQSLRSDSVHLNVTGQALVATQVQGIIQAKSW